MHSIERLVRIHNLRLEQQNGSHDAALIERDERGRRSATRLLIAQHEIEALRRELRKENASAADLSGQSSQMQNSLRQLEANEASQRRLLAEKDAEILGLKDKLQLLDNRSLESKKELQENAKLREELAQLLPEIDELQSQVASHQNVVSAKKALQKQVIDLETQLTESQRTNQQNNTHKQSLSRLEKTLAETEKLLSRERARFSELETKMKQTQSRQMNTKSPNPIANPNARPPPNSEMFEESEEEEQEEQEGADEQDNLENDQLVRSNSSHKKAKTSDTLVDSWADAVVGTPEKDGATTKATTKTKGFLAGVGQKSNFSVTPFLNKTNAVYESGNSDSSEEDSVTDVRTSMPGVAANIIPTARLQRNRVQHKAERKSTAFHGINQSRPILGDSKSSERNKAIVSAAQKARPQTKQLIQLSTEIDGKENTPSPVSLKPSLLNNQGGDGRKRKRMVFGAAMRAAGDDEDAEYLAQPIRTANKRVPKMNLGGAISVFASDGTSFSPLKRDRRGRSTSFLG
ncbi:hypothetical protein VHEMI07873 [[Torrubiella] hemipterigena]|uniref:Rossmann-fold NAD(P)(+)-binding protein n=1 Tax=[Torrubiella] hemipterigena TaxID=1531966 RepID=A0A0A1T4Z5_9HYPO|nr:hypothetical protein VHEMI07873 [[Torrubiella] hemipterigena]